MKTTDELVRELADREAIRNLPLRYCDCICRNDLEGLISLFTEDASFIAKNPENEVVTRGRGELKKMYENLIRQTQPRPYTHTHVIELRNEHSATGRCYVELRNAKVELEWLGSGYYEDEYAKVRGEWKFASRRLNEMGMTPLLRNFVVT